MKRSHHRLLATIGAAGLCAATLGMGGAATAAPSNPYVNPDNGHTSTYTRTNTETTWPAARDAAAATPAPEGCVNHLAVITSEDENSYIESAIGFANNTWIGAKRSDATDTGQNADGGKSVGDFEWVTGEPFVYDNWYPGEPNNYTFPDSPDVGEPFAQYFRDFTWNDIDANNVGPALVETECTPTGLQVTQVDPNNGPSGGGNTVTVYGSGFTAPGGTSVVFGAKKATNVNVVNDFTLTATVPSVGKSLKKAKTVDVQVKIKSKKSAKTAADQYTYNADVAAN